MVRRSRTPARYLRRSPHTRGDGPTFNWAAAPMTALSPHAWGWSVRRSRWPFLLYVLPTRVGMVRLMRAGSLGERRSPHTRGDGPYQGCAFYSLGSFSPHAWGWSVIF